MGRAGPQDLGAVRGWSITVGYRVGLRDPGRSPCPSPPSSAVRAPRLCNGGQRVAWHDIGMAVRRGGDGVCLRCPLRDIRASQDGAVGRDPGRSRPVRERFLPSGPPRGWHQTHTYVQKACGSACRPEGTVQLPVHPRGVPGASPRSRGCCLSPHVATCFCPCCVCPTWLPVHISSSVPR